MVDSSVVRTASQAAISHIQIARFRLGRINTAHPRHTIHDELVIVNQALADATKEIEMAISEVADSKPDLTIVK